MRTPVALLAFLATAWSAKWECPKTDAITKTDVDNSAFVAAIKIESADLNDPFYDYYNVKYTAVYWTYYDWFSKYSIKRDAPKTLKVKKGCPVFNEWKKNTGKYYVLGCEYYDQEASCNIAKYWYDVTDDEWRTIRRRGIVE